MVRNFEVQYESGLLNHATLANERCAPILTHACHEASREANRVSDALLKRVALLGGSGLVDGIKSFLRGHV